MRWGRFCESCRRGPWGGRFGAGLSGSGGVSAEVAAALDGVVAAEDAGDGGGVGDVLDFEDAGGEGSGCIGVFDGDGSLEDDDAMVELFVDKVDCAAGDFCTVGEGLPLGVQAWEGGQERWMDVEDAIWEGLDEVGGEQAHVAGEEDEVDAGLVEMDDEGVVVFGAFAAIGGDGLGGEAEGSGGLETGGLGAVREHDGDLGLGEAALGDGAMDGEEVRAATGEEDAETVHEVLGLIVGELGPYRAVELGALERDEGGSFLFL